MLRFAFLVILAAGLGMLSLTGCAQPQACAHPILVSYSKADDAALKAELDANKLPVTRRYLRDYAGLRAAERVSSGGQ